MNRMLLRGVLSVGLTFLCWLTPTARAQTNVQYLFNINFAQPGAVREGMAATWNWTNDVWNTVTLGSVTNVAQQHMPFMGGDPIDIVTWGTVTNLAYAN